MNVLSSDFFQSVFLFVGVWATAEVLKRVLARNLSVEKTRWWYLLVRHFALAVTVVGVSIIWWPQLHSVIIALGAAAVGLFVALREVWLSILSFWLRLVSNNYSIGDYVQVDGVRGRVLDITWQYTVLAEQGPGEDSLTYSGRRVHVPNNRFLLAGVSVDNMTGAYSAHTFNIPLPKGADALAAQELLQQLLHAECGPYVPLAMAHLQRFEQNSLYEAPSAVPRVLLRFEADGQIILAARFVSPATEKLRMEQRVLHAFLAEKTLAMWPPPKRHS